MGGVDLADQMHRFYTCTHKSPRRWYLWLFWFLLDLAIDIAFILECYSRPIGGRRKSKRRKGKACKAFNTAVVKAIYYSD